MKNFTFRTTKDLQCGNTVLVEVEVTDCSCDRCYRATGKANCHGGDVFDYAVGYRLARAKAQYKCIQYLAKQHHKVLSDFQEMADRESALADKLDKITIDLQNYIKNIG